MQTHFGGKITVQVRPGDSVSGSQGKLLELITAGSGIPRLDNELEGAEQRPEQQLHLLFPYILPTHLGTGIHVGIGHIWQILIGGNASGSGLRTAEGRLDRRDTPLDHRRFFLRTQGKIAIIGRQRIHAEEIMVGGGRLPVKVLAGSDGIDLGFTLAKACLVGLGIGHYGIVGRFVPRLGNAHVGDDTNLVYAGLPVDTLVTAHDFPAVSRLGKRPLERRNAKMDAVIL